MNKCIFCFLMLLCGCASVSQRIDSSITELKDLDRFQEATANASYSSAFQSALNVLRDLNISILKKDYDQKQIIGTRMPEELGSNYGIYFTPDNTGKIKITVKAMGLYYDDKFILGKIIEEIQLQEKIRGE